MVILFTVSAQIFAAPTELGNGNDGKDLLEFKEITEGEIFESRKEAVAFLSKINLRGIQGLGYLKDEVEKTKLLITRDGLTPQELLNLGAFKTGNNPVVYARTFPRPHAPTRFFPASRELSRKQLVTLHIHEGLHRALPPEIRANEEIVENITKVITSPDSTFEDIVVVMDRNLPQRQSQPMTPASSTAVNDPHIGFFKDNFFKYKIQSYSDNALQLWNSSQSFGVKSTLYQGKTWNIQFNPTYHTFSNSFDQQGSSDKMIHFSLRVEKKANDKRTWGYQITRTGWLDSNVYNNPLSRDITTLQLDLTRRYDSFNLISKVYFSGMSSTIGSIELLKDPNLTTINGGIELSISGRDIYNIQSDFGSIVSASLGAQNFWSDNMTSIVSLDVHKMSGYTSLTDERVDDPSSPFGYRYSSKDNNLSSVPALFVINTQASYLMGDFSLDIRYFRLLNTPDNPELGEINLTSLGDPMGRGLGKQSFSMALAYNF